jgi:hypothetical protein
MRMLYFLDGPATAVFLSCAQAPLLLRVVRGPEGHFDALALFDDEPEPWETIHVYVKVADDGRFYVRYRDHQGRRGGHWEPCARYRHFELQPNDATARNQSAWEAWVLIREMELAKTAPPPAPED